MIRSATLALILSGTMAASAQVVVSDDWVRLGDVAPVAGEAASVLVAPSPPPGEQLALDPAFLTSVAKSSGVLIALPSDSPVWVTREGAPVPPTPTAPPSAQIARSAPTPDVGTPIAMDVAPNPGWVLVVVEPVPRGEVLHQSDLTWVAPETVRGSARFPIDQMSDAVGMEVKRNLRADTPIQMSDLKRPALIRKGDTVQLVYASNGVRLTTSGLAQQDAGRGEPVRILNQYTKRTIEAVAFADGEARVGSR